MNPRLTAGMVLLLLVLGGYAYYLSRQPATEDEPTAADEPVPLHETEYHEYDIVAWEIVGPQSAAQFVRTDLEPTRDWAMTFPIAIPPEQLDQVRVNGAAVRLASLTAHQAIDNVSDLTQYGLNPPLVTATLTISSGETVTVLGGLPTPVGFQSYVRLPADESTVYVVPGVAIDELRRMLDAPPVDPFYEGP